MHNRAVQPAKEERDRRQIRQTREYSGRGEDYLYKGHKEDRSIHYTHRTDRRKNIQADRKIHIGHTGRQEDTHRTFRQTGRYTFRQTGGIHPRQ